MPEPDFETARRTFDLARILLPLAIVGVPVAVGGVILAVRWLRAADAGMSAVAREEAEADAMFGPIAKS